MGPKGSLRGIGEIQGYAKKSAHTMVYMVGWSSKPSLVDYTRNKKNDITAAASGALMNKTCKKVVELIENFA